MAHGSLLLFLESVLVNEMPSENLLVQSLQ